MNIILVVILYTVNSFGGFDKTEFHETVADREQCEQTAKLVNLDKQLNNIDSFVFSAECKFKGKAHARK